jgi:hypothetical protein
MIEDAKRVAVTTKDWKNVLRIVHLSEESFNKLLRPILI